MNWHSMSPEDVAKTLSTNLSTGLSEAEVEKRLQTYGLNEIPAKKKSPIIMFARQFANFLIGILIVATLVSAVLGELIDALAILAVVLVMGFFGFVQEYRAERTLEALKKLATPRCRVLRDGVELEIEASRLVPGDIVLLREGDRIPADLRIFEADNLEIDESPLTGESVPVSKQPDILLDARTPVSDRRNMAFMGTYVVRGRGKGIVVATGLNTELGRIAKAVAEAKEERTPLEEELDYFGKRIGVIILGIAIIVFFTSFFVSREELIKALMVSVALAVAAIPEGLPAIATAVLAIGAYRMAKKNALVKKLAAVESLGSVDILCADKTGTITKGEMTVKVVKLLDTTCEVEGVGYEPRGLIKCNGNDELGDLLKMIAVHTILDAKLVKEQSGWGVKGSPTEGAALVLAYKGLGDGGVEKAVRELELVKVYPFDRFRKRKSTVHRFADKYLVIVTGAPEILLSLSSKIKAGNGEVEVDDALKMKMQKYIEELASQGYRTFGVAYRIMNDFNPSYRVEEVEKELVFYAILGIIDPPREGVKEAVEAAKRAGIKTIMVTGDHRLTALAIARMIGLDVDSGMVLEGRDLDVMSDENLLKIVDKVVVYARVTPEHKARIVKMLKKKGYRVAMTGDGVNDAPALKEAHVGVSMGIRGTDVAKEASQLVLMDDNYVTLVEAVKEGRVIYENLKKPINYLLTCNFGEVATVFGAEMLGRPVPLEPIHLLWINVVTDSMPAAALGLEPPEPGIMERPPRRPDERFITRRKLVYYAVMGVALASVAIWNFLLHVDKSVEYARTAAFSAIVFSEIGRALSSRSENVVFWKLKYNKWLIPALLVSLGIHMIVLYTPLRLAFKVDQLSPEAWIPISIAPIVVLVLDEVRKLLKLRI